MTPAQLVADLERRATEAEQIGATAPVAAIYRALAADVASLNGHNGPSPAPQPDRLLTASKVASRLGCSVRYVYAHATTFPFTVRVGNLVRFSEAGLARYLGGRGALARTPPPSKGA